MDETREIVMASRQGASSEAAAEGVRTAPAAELHERFASARGVEDTARLLASEALARLPFERAAVLVEEAESAAGGEEDRRRPARIAALLVRPGGERTSEKLVPGERILDPSVAVRALAAPGPLPFTASLAGVGLPGEPRERAILCVPLALPFGRRGALCLDRPLSRGQASSAECEAAEALARSAAPHLARELLAERVVELERALEVSPGEESTAAAGDERSGAEPVEERFGIIGRDEKVERILKVIDKIKDKKLNVCIFGESGTGKELVARAIHLAGPRRDKPFVSENCGAIAETLLESELFGHVKGSFTGADEDRKGLFELADGGTLFLDEIGDMPESMQRKLLRTLEEGKVRPIGSKTTVEVDVRVICASNRDLKHLVREGKFRADLYYRLNVIQIDLPPLRERKGDIPLLAEFFLSRFAEEAGARKRLSSGALRLLEEYSWPGNVRELRNVLRRAVLTSPGNVLNRRDLEPLLKGEAGGVWGGEDLRRDDRYLLLRVPARETFNEIIAECERLVLLNALEECGWNKSRVTRRLRIPRQSLYNKIHRYRLERPAGDPAELSE